MNRPSWEFDRIRTCVNKSHNLAPKPLGHKLHITCSRWIRTTTSRTEIWYATITPWSTFVAPEGVEPSLTEPKPVVLPLYHRAVFCGASWSWTTFSGFSVLRIHQVCQSSLLCCPRWIRTTTSRSRIWRANHYTMEQLLWWGRDSNPRPAAS